MCRGGLGDVLDKMTDELGFKRKSEVAISGEGNLQIQGMLCTKRGDTVISWKAYISNHALSISPQQIRGLIKQHICLQERFTKMEIIMKGLLQKG